MEGWVGDHPAKRAYYQRLFGQETLQPEFQKFVDEWKSDPAAQEQMRIKEQNKCHDFAWWDKHVMFRLTGRHHPWHPDHKKVSCRMSSHLSEPFFVKIIRVEGHDPFEQFVICTQCLFLPASLQNQQVTCGSHKALSCELCPQGHGKDWCNGDCSWCESSATCVAKVEKAKLCKSNVLKGGGIRINKNGPRKITQAVQGNDLHLSLRQRARLSETMNEKDATLTLSVVLPCGFEHAYFAKTAESVFYETPAETLKEIVIVDDASDPPLKRLWSEEEAAKFLVKYVRLDKAQGLIGAKQAGAEAATGDIIVFFDCHVKVRALLTVCHSNFRPDPHKLLSFQPAPGYWRPYVKEISENYKRVVIPTITNLNVDNWREENRPSVGQGGMSKCYLTFDAEFKWTSDNTQYVPIMSGGLLAISRKWFFEIGGYDKNMKGWGGENLDQSLRIWTCGGEIVSASESYVAHMWRDGTAKTRAKYTLGRNDAMKNKARAVKAHLGPWFEKSMTFPSFQGWQDVDTSR